MSEVNSLVKAGHALFTQRRFEEALEIFRRVVKTAPGAVAPLLNEAICLRQLGRDHEAAAILEQAREIEPTSLAVLEHLGGVLKQIGRFDEALNALSQAILAHPKRVSLALDYVTCKRMSVADLPRLAAMFESTNDCKLKSEEAISLHFAIAKYHDDVGEYGVAMRHFDLAHDAAAAELKKRGRSYNEAQMTARFQEIIAAFDRRRLATLSPACSSSHRPLFIFGMVRSGTTLVEQILTRQSQIVSGGELSFWPQNWRRLMPTGSTPVDHEVISLAQNYLAQLSAIDFTSKLVTDKMPGNYIALGSIHTVFPRAKLIYCKRKAIDNCVSIYTTPFRSGHEWIHTRKDIVSFYRLHERLMEHWRHALPPGIMLEVQYEDLVTQPELEARRIIEFLGLEWEAACLSPESNERQVSTPSQWQVRQPVYKSSINRWKNYKPWLGELSELLSPEDKESP